MADTVRPAEEVMIIRMHQMLDKRRFYENYHNYRLFPAYLPHLNDDPTQGATGLIRRN